jgi:hypothetical protein
MNPRDGKILSVSIEEYRAMDAFSASIAKVIDSKSPAHALQALADERCPTEAMDNGAIGHRLLLGKGDDYAVLDFTDWRTSAARLARDHARGGGKIPILSRRFDEIAVAVSAISARINKMGIIFDGESELAISWTESDAQGDQLCRGRLDHARIGEDAAQIFELKLVDSAAPDVVERSSETMGYAIATAAYIRAIEALRPDLRGRVEFYFIFAELAPPFAVNVCQPDGLFLDVGAARWIRAVKTWRECVQRQHWPAYGEAVNYITVPPWGLSREAKKEGLNE